MISRADPCFCWGEACFVSEFSMCLVCVGVQEFEFMPTGEAGRRKCFASWWHQVPTQAKLTQSSVGSNSFTLTVGLEG